MESLFRFILLMAQPRICSKQETLMVQQSVLTAEVVRVILNEAEKRNANVPSFSAETYPGLVNALG